MSHCVYVINLDGSDARMASAKAQLDAAGIAFERVAAFDGRHLSPDAFPDYDADRARRYMGRPLHGGEIGCYLSHLDCARRFLQTGTNWALVLEDDFTLVPGAMTVLRETIDWLARTEEPWWQINIGADQRKVYTPLARFGCAGNDHELARAHYFPLTTTGIVWSRQGAEEFVRNHSAIHAPVDCQFRHWLIRARRGLSLHPPLAPAAEFPSDIEAIEGDRYRYDHLPVARLRKARRYWLDKLFALVARGQARSGTSKGLE